MSFFIINDIRLNLPMGWVPFQMLYLGPFSNVRCTIEADYIKNWRNGRFTAGASYTANRNRSQYESLGGDIFHQRQDKIYIFAEYFHRFGKWTATAGMGVQYTDFLFKETNQGTHTWNPRPQATITYSLTLLSTKNGRG